MPAIKNVLTGLANEVINSLGNFKWKASYISCP